MEVLAAMMILAIALLGIAQGQSGSVRTIIRSENLSQAMNLAEEKMNEIQLELRFQSFQAFPESEQGNFDDEKLENFHWERHLEQVSLGCFIPEAAVEEQDQMGLYAFAENIFEEAIRKIVVRVEWEERGRTQEVQLSQLYIRFQDIPRM